MRNKNSFPAWVINVTALLTCVTILLYLASQSKVTQRDKDKERNGHHHAADVKYIEFFSVR